MNRLSALGRKPKWFDHIIFFLFFSFKTIGGICGGTTLAKLLHTSSRAAKRRGDPDRVKILNSQRSLSVGNVLFYKHMSLWNLDCFTSFAMTTKVFCKRARKQRGQRRNISDIVKGLKTFASSMRIDLLAPRRVVQRGRRRDRRPDSCKHYISNEAGLNQEQPEVAPQVMHFKHVPFLTSVRLPHSWHASPSYPLSLAITAVVATAVPPLNFAAPLPFPLPLL
jgi:hypothetical protein